MLSPDLAGKQPGPDVCRPLHHAAVYHLGLVLQKGPSEEAVVAAFNQEKALVGAFSVITDLPI